MNIFLVCLLLLHQIQESSSKKTTLATSYKSKTKSRSPSSNSKKKGSKRSTGSSMSNKALGGVSSIGNKLIKGARQSLKSSIDLLAGKHVTLKQILGKWRLNQDVVLRKGISISCPSTFELFKNGTITTSFEDQTYPSVFKFKERKWPRYCTIEFEARAFKGPSDKEPVPMFYKAYFKRSIFNSKVILMRGKVYRVSGKML